MGGEQNVVAVGTLRLACAPEGESLRMKVWEHLPTGKKGVAVRPGGTEQSVMSVRCAARTVVEEAPCGVSGAMATSGEPLMNMHAMQLNASQLPAP